MTRHTLRGGLVALGVAMALPVAAPDAPPVATAEAPTPATRQSDERRNGVSLLVGLHFSDVLTDIVTSPWDTQADNGADFPSVGARYRA